MTDAYTYDALRPPSGKGRKDGALFEMGLDGQTLKSVKYVCV